MTGRKFTAFLFVDATIKDFFLLASGNIDEKDADCSEMNWVKGQRGKKILIGVV